MAKLGSPFWGQPSYAPKDKDVARFLEAIREITKKQKPERALRTATSAMHAIVAFIADKFGLKEVMALLDRLRGEVAGETR